MKIDFILINAIVLPLFLGSLFLETITGVSIPKSIIGSLVFFIITPITLLQIFPQQLKKFDSVEKYFLVLTIFFFVLTPEIFLSNLLGIRISPLSILSISTFVFFVSLLARIFQQKQTAELPLRYGFFKKEHIPIFIALTSFIVLHGINYFFYRFMPEMDGYSDLERIEDIIKSGYVQETYRGFFTTAASVISIVSGIDPYHVFITILIGLQNSLLLVLNRILRLLKNTSRSVEYLVYALALSVPVFNMEIDTLRPQSIVIIFFPILFYFVYRFFLSRDIAYLVPAAMIGLLGFNYHELFVFPLAIYGVWILCRVLSASIRQARDKRDRIIALLLVVIMLLSISIVEQRLDIFQFFFSVTKSIFSSISDFSMWRIWFLDSYSDAAGSELGWPGISGAAKYYAYYFSPALVFVTAIGIFSLIKKDYLENTEKILILTAAPIITAFFLFAEIFPRMGYFLFPERSWILIDIFIILAAFPIIKYLSSQHFARVFFVVLIFACFSGIAGSFYVAASKKSFISDNEYAAALWIKENTATDSIFITQKFNTPMLFLFARRNTLSTNPIFFLSNDIIDKNSVAESETKEVEALIESGSSLIKDYLRGSITPQELIFKADGIKTELSSISLEKSKAESLSSRTTYILYSYDKFNSIYKERRWYQHENAYNANINKFNEIYRLVYNNNGIYIWIIE